MQLRIGSRAVDRVPDEDRSEASGEGDISGAKHVAVERDGVVLCSHTRMVGRVAASLTRSAATEETIDLVPIIHS